MFNVVSEQLKNLFSAAWFYNNVLTDGVYFV